MTTSVMKGQNCLSEYLHRGSAEIDDVLSSKWEEMLLNTVNIAQDYSALSTYSEVWSEEDLWKVVYMSKNQYELHRAAANAISILNYKGVSFAGRDMSSLYLSGANLSGAMMQGANFSDTDLSQSDLRNAIINYCKFHHANLRHAKVTHENVVVIPADVRDACSFSRERDTVLALCGPSGAVYVVDGDREKAVLFHLPTNARTISVTEQLQQASGCAPVTLRREMVNCIAVSADGTFHVFGSDDLVVYLHSSRTTVIVKSDAGSIRSVATTKLHPKLIAYCHEEVKLWDIEHNTMQTLPGTVISPVLTLSDCEEVVAVLETMMNTVTAWSYAGPGKRLWTRSGDVVSMQFSPVQSILALGHSYRTGAIAIVSSWTGEELCRFIAHGDDVDVLRFKPSGDVLISASVDKSVKLWDAFGGWAPLGTIHAHSRPVKAMVLTRDETAMITLGRDETAKFVPFANALQRTGCESSHRKDIAIVHVCALLGIMVTADIDGKIILWHVETGDRIHSVDGPKSLPMSLEAVAQTVAVLFECGAMLTIELVPPFASSTRQVLTAGCEGKHLSTLGRGMLARPTWTFMPSPVVPVQYYLDGCQWRQRCTLGSRGQLVACFCPSTASIDVMTIVSAEAETESQAVGSGAAICSIPCAEATALALSSRPTRQLLAAGSIDFSVTLYSIDVSACSWAQVATLGGHNCAIECLAFGADDSILGVGSHDCLASWWCVERLLAGVPGVMPALSPSPTPPGSPKDVDDEDDARPRSSRRSKVAMHRLPPRSDPDNALLCSIAQPDCVTALAVSPCGALVAVGNKQGSATVLRVSDGRCLCDIAGFRDTVTSLAFRDSQMLVVVSAAREVQVVRLVHAAVVCGNVGVGNGGTGIDADAGPAGADVDSFVTCWHEGMVGSLALARLRDTAVDAQLAKILTASSLQDSSQQEAAIQKALSEGRFLNVAVLSRVLSRSQPCSSQPYFFSALAMYQLQDWEAAEAFATYGLHLNPNTPELGLLLGKLLELRGDGDGALQAKAQALGASSARRDTAASVKSRFKQLLPHEGSDDTRRGAGPTFRAFMSMEGPNSNQVSCKNIMAFPPSPAESPSIRLSASSRKSIATATSGAYTVESPLQPPAIPDRKSRASSAAAASRQQIKALSGAQTDEEGQPLYHLLSDLQRLHDQAVDPADHRRGRWCCGCVCC